MPPGGAARAPRAGGRPAPAGGGRRGSSDLPRRYRRTPRGTAETAGQLRDRAPSPGPPPTPPRPAEAPRAAPSRPVPARSGPSHPAASPQVPNRPPHPSHTFLRVVLGVAEAGPGVEQLLQLLRQGRRHLLEEGGREGGRRAGLRRGRAGTPPPSTSPHGARGSFPCPRPNPSSDKCPR